MQRKVKWDAKFVVILIMVVIFSYQAGMFTLKYAKGVKIEQLSMEPEFPIERMTFCTRVFSDYITKPEGGEPLNNEEKGEISWIESHEIYEDHIDGSSLFQEEAIQKVKDMSNSDLLDSYQKYHGIQSVLSADDQGVHKEKVYMKPYSRLKKFACGTVQSVNVSKKHVAPALQPNSKYARWFFLFIPTFTMVSKPVTYFTPYFVKETAILDPYDHYEVEVKAGFSSGGLELVIARVKPTRRRWKATKDKPCESYSGYPPAGFSEAICRGKCQSEAFHAIYGCSNLVWLDQGIEQNKSVVACRRNMFNGTVVSLYERVEKEGQKCVARSECAHGRFCEEWSFSMDITRGLSYQGNQFITPGMNQRVQGFLVIPEPSFTALQEVYEINFITWLVYIGGLLGLWLGLGVMSILLEVYEFLVQKCCRSVIVQAETGDEAKIPVS